MFPSSASLLAAKQINSRHSPRRDFRQSRGGFFVGSAASYFRCQRQKELMISSNSGASIGLPLLDLRKWESTQATELYARRGAARVDQSAGVLHAAGPACSQVVNCQHGHFALRWR